MPSIHEVVKVESKWSWKGRRNTYFLKRTPLEPGFCENIEVTRHDPPRDNYVTKAFIRKDRVSIKVVKYIVSPDDLDSLFKSIVRGSAINRDPELKAFFRYQS